MTKLCYKVGGTEKKYDLKDSANKPRLAVKSGGGTKYLGLKQGTKSGELQVKVGGQSYYVQTETILPLNMTEPLNLSYIHFVRSQSTADDYNWSTDPENNAGFKTAYGVDGHSYVPNSWGGTGPFRMYPTQEYYSNTPISSSTFEYTMTEPFYFVWTDQSTTIQTHAHGGTTYVIDVLKNNVSLASYKNTSTPILFETGDKMTAVIMFGGYNTMEDGGASGWTYGWFPKLRPTNGYKPSDAPFGFYFRHPAASINNTYFYGTLVDFEENPSASTAGLATKSSPEYYTLKNDYKFYPSDNGTFSSTTNYKDIYTHRHGCHIYSPKIMINGIEHSWNKEWDLHTGDRICLLFRVDSNWGDDFWSWDYGYRLKLRLKA